jgi:hypothetical protein
VARKNIRVNAIAPESVMTPLLTGMSGSEQSAKDTVLPMIPMGRTSDPSEIAQLVLLVSSDAASFISGQAVAIDGGGLVAGAEGSEGASSVGYDRDGLDLDFGAILHEGRDLDRGHRRETTADCLAIGAPNSL